MRERGHLALKSIRESRGFSWKEVNFHSYEEREIAKLIFDKERLIEGINCHVKSKWYEHDFYYKGVFIEYHPNLYDPKLKRKITQNEYIAPRLKSIKKSEYNGTKLIVIFDSLRHNHRKVLKKIEELKRL